MEEKVVLLTGASSGIGAHTVHFLVEKKGYRKLAIVARTESKLEAVAEKLRGLGATDVLVLCLDMSKDDECVAAVKRTVDHFGRLDALIVNAAGHGGEGAHKSVREMDPDLFEPTFQLNVKSPFLMTKAALPHLEKTKGAIVFMGSLTATRVLVSPGISLYGASKAALLQFTRYAAREEAKNGVRINVVTPGIIVTRMLAGGSEDPKVLDHYRDLVAESIPAGRGGEVEDVAPVIAFLISDENTYVTGTDIQVDGAIQWNMKGPNWGE